MAPPDKGLTGGGCRSFNLTTRVINHEKMNLTEFVKKTFNPVGEGLSIFCHRPRIFCKDGLSLSVQGSQGHYCTPRETEDSYSAMEIGFPSRRVEKLKQYAEEPKRLTKTVYGWVPVEVIQEVIDEHGGIDEKKTFKIKKLALELKKNGFTYRQFDRNAQ